MESSTSLLLKNLCWEEDNFSEEDAIEKWESNSAMKILKRFLLYGRFDEFASDCLCEDVSFSEETLLNVELSIRDIDRGGLIPVFVYDLVEINMRIKMTVKWNSRVPLVLSMISKIQEHRPLAITTAVRYLYNSDDFLLFIKFSMEITPCVVDDLLVNGILLWYSADPRWLAKEVTSSLGELHGWSHRKVLELTNVQSHQDPSWATVIEYILNSGEPDFTYDNSILGCYFEDIDLLNAYPTAMPEVITSLKLVPSQIDPKNLNDRLLWEKLVPNMDIRDLLYCIQYFHEKGFFHVTNDTFDAGFVKIVVDRLRESRRIHPSDFLLALQTTGTLGGGRSPDVPEICEELNQELMEQMLRSFRSIEKTKMNITVIINCDDLADHRCGLFDKVDAKVAAATVAFSLKSAALKANVFTLQGGHRVNLDMEDFFDAVQSIASQSSNKTSPNEIRDFFRENQEDDLYVVIGFKTNHREYLHVLEEYGSSKYVFCNLGSPCKNIEYSDDFHNRESNILVTSAFNERTCDLILAYATFL